VLGRDCLAPGLGERGVQPPIAEAAPENSSGTGVLGRALAQWRLGNTLSCFLSSGALILFQALAKDPTPTLESPTTSLGGGSKA